MTCQPVNLHCVPHNISQFSLPVCCRFMYGKVPGKVLENVEALLSLFSKYNNNMEQHFRNIYANFRKLSSGSFLSAFKFAPECLKFPAEWFAFRKRFRKSGNFSGKIMYQLPLFPKFLKFWVNGKCPKCIQEILVLRESSARTTMCKKVCCTCKLDLLTLALLITSPG